MSEDAIYKLASVRHTLRGVAAMMDQLLRQVLGMTGLTLPHALILVSLARAPTSRQVELKSLPGIGSPYLTRLLDELADRGLVGRVRSSGDRRQVLLSLTESGKAAAACLLKALSALTDTEWLNALEQGAVLLRCLLQQTSATVPC